MKKIIFFILLLLLVFSVSCKKEPKLETIEDLNAWFIKLNSKVKSYRCTMELNSTFKQGKMLNETKSINLTEFRNHNNLLQTRNDITEESIIIYPNKKKIITKRTGFSLLDGEYHYSYTEMDMNGKITKNAMKKKSSTPAVVIDFFDPENAYYTYNRLEDAEVEGQSAYVVEWNPKTKTMAKLIMYYDKKYALPLKVENYDFEGKEITSTSLYKDYEVNVKIPDERFVFKAPEGVKVTEY